jgi:arylsulfatase A-like enzyme
MKPQSTITALCCGLLALATAHAADKKPNVLVITGDDIGIFNISAFHQGMVGYSTPNIDRLSKDGGMLMTYYAQQSCTAGRSAFITGQRQAQPGDRLNARSPRREARVAASPPTGRETGRTAQAQTRGAAIGRAPGHPASIPS